MGSDSGQVLLLSGGTLSLGGKHKNHVSAHLENSRRERGKQAVVENPSQGLGVSLEQMIHQFGVLVGGSGAESVVDAKAEREG